MSDVDVAPSTAPTPCPHCGEPTAAGEAFCEACGGALGAVVPAASEPADPEVDQRTQQIVTLPPAAPDPDPALPCAQCGSTAAADGYCNRCGARMPVWRDHFHEELAPWVAGVCDRGVAHARNEDAMAIGPADAQARFVAMVVCDGVTSAPDSDVASLAAARAARAALERLRDELVAARPGSPALQVQQLCQGVIDAGAGAQAEAKAVADRAGQAQNPPSCTFAAAVVHDGVLAVGWAGDSRVYWLPDDGDPQQVGVDDSWATLQMAKGVPRDVAEADPQAHAITRWLGADSPTSDVQCATLPVGDAAGWVLVCSDGLWNYVSPAAEMRQLVAGFHDGTTTALAVAAHLVAYANDKGGHDNVTAALTRLPIPT